ncbi:MAG: sugar phosphate nucleotidyltransferase [Candidatus Thorarchaeota archaeon]|jgi:CTP:phosphocholine cytidylyltransferase-like protein
MFNVVILAAGVGSRLAPLTETVSKALIRVNQKSILHKPFGKGSDRSSCIVQEQDLKQIIFTCQ